jgi:hypothetical protein
VKVFDLFSSFWRRFIAETKALPHNPLSCQGWGRGFESHRPLQFSESGPRLRTSRPNTRASEIPAVTPEERPMPTIRKRGTKWQVQIRREGQCSVSRSFIAKKDAEMWAREMERRADLRELPTDLKLLDQYTLGDLVRRYKATVTPRKRGAITPCNSLYNIGFRILLVDVSRRIIC